MNWTGDLRAVEDGQFLLTLYRQDGREFCRLSDAADTLPTDADIVARVRLSGMDAFLRDCHPPLNRAVCMKDSSALKRCLDALAREAAEARVCAEEAASLNAALALIELLRSAADEPCALPSPSRRVNAVLRRMLDEYRRP